MTKHRLSRWSALAPQFQALLRIVAAFIFITYGTMKLFAFPMAMPPGNEAPLMSQTGIGGILEIVGGALMLDRPLHAARRVHPVRRDGGRLLPVPLSPKLLAAREPGHTGRALLLHLVVLLGGRRRAVERGPGARGALGLPASRAKREGGSIFGPSVDVASDDSA